MFVIALFFNDSIIHKIYENKGFFNIISVMPILIYSSLICSIINNIMKKVYLPQKNVLELKYEKNINNLNAKMVNIMKCLNIKFICFFVINFIFLLFFWYYLSCFSIVYKNTQIYFLKVITISFSILLILPFIIYLIVSFFRISGLKGPGKCLYKFSRIIQMV